MLTLVLVVLELNKRRGVAQLARVLAWGARGRLFKSGHSDHFIINERFRRKEYVLYEMWKSDSRQQRLLPELWTELSEC